MVEMLSTWYQLRGDLSELCLSPHCSSSFFIFILTFGQTLNIFHVDGPNGKFWLCQSLKLSLKCTGGFATLVLLVFVFDFFPDQLERATDKKWSARYHLLNVRKMKYLLRDTKGIRIKQIWAQCPLILFSRIVKLSAYFRIFGKYDHCHDLHFFFLFKVHTFDTIYMMLISASHALEAALARKWTFLSLNPEISSNKQVGGSYQKCVLCQEPPLLIVLFFNESLGLCKMNLFIHFCQQAFIEVPGQRWLSENMFITLFFLTVHHKQGHNKNQRGKNNLYV